MHSNHAIVTTTTTITSFHFLKSYATPTACNISVFQHKEWGKCSETRGV